MVTTLKHNTRLKYFFGFLGLFILEIIIARYVNDNFVRPYLGDFLVVILLYCFLMTITNFSVLKSLLIVLIFSFSIEFLQLLNIEEILRIKTSKILMLVLGNSFSVLDLGAYCLGLLFCYFLEYRKTFYKNLSK
tara:strand:+ start:896 stop:1297 length:402 start_codon:yes stop_codon:yes gene_type:complete